jgi:two-component system, chemotaxis family, chemotaxis protein CheY
MNFLRGDNYMKTLIVEDDFTSRLLMQELLKSYGLPHVAINGQEAVDAVRAALEAGQPYDLICLDIMMPGMDGLQALKEIRALEDAKGIFSTEGAKILMTTALTDIQNKIDAFSGLCDGYLTKPIHKARLLDELRKHNLIP